MNASALFGLIITSAAVFGLLSVSVRGRLSFTSAFAWGALLGPFGLLITILLSIRSELQPRIPPAPIPPAPQRPKPESLQALADQRITVGQL